ncbi:unnamed protein product [Pleuronectes platessa]|uniref:Uncharacterized protein n=1 Tax=Pleuronectes platessa TaxID=8262 RepID=A0A9N7VRL9_PLEPL|nr:unnamed protein product [Pleuronectes platessa]
MSCLNPAGFPRSTPVTCPPGRDRVRVVCPPVRRHTTLQHDNQRDSQTLGGATSTGPCSLRLTGNSRSGFERRRRCHRLGCGQTRLNEAKPETRDACGHPVLKMSEESTSEKAVETKEEVRYREQPSLLGWFCELFSGLLLPDSGATLLQFPPPLLRQPITLHHY